MSSALGGSDPGQARMTKELVSPVIMGFSRKRFFITLGGSVVVWYVTVLFQGIAGYKAPFNILFSGSICKVTGFPIATCLYGKAVWLVNIVNIIFWFWVIHLFWGWFGKKRD